VALLKKMVLLMMVLILLPMPIYAYCGVPSSSNGVISWWTFNNNVLDSVGSNDGIRYNFTDGYGTGKYGQALEFNSTAEQFIDIGNDSSLNFGTGDFSIEAWIKTNSSSRFLGKLDLNGVGYYLAILDGTFEFGINDNESEYIDVVGTAVIDDDDWHHIVGVRNETTGYVYVDGIFDNNQTNALFGDIGNNGGFILGTDTSDLSSSFVNGTIDNARIWDRALSETEIASLYSDDTFGSCGVNYTALDENHTSYVHCLTNDIIYGSEWNAYNGVYYQHNASYLCDNGCDTVTNQCLPLSYESDLMNILIIALIIIIIALLYEWGRR
jgi:hypothetical protein